MFEPEARPRPVPFPRDWVPTLLATAARAPSILNSQPWLFRATTYAIELYPDPSRKLRSDVTGREMVISCGAALFGLRLAIRALGYQPVVRLLPVPEQPNVLARVTLGAKVPVTVAELRLMAALPHRHTHRGAFAAAKLPKGLLIGLQHDAVVEHASLALVDQPMAYSRLSAIVERAAASLRADASARADIHRWVRPPGGTARDGVPASSITRRSGVAGRSGRAGSPPGQLAQRDLDLGRGIGELAADGSPPAATAILLTQGDTRADWLRAGQALHRLLVHAASEWVFASLYSQPLESAPARAMIRSELALPGAPQVLLQFGVANAARPTARRPVADLLVEDRPK